MAHLAKPLKESLTGLWLTGKVFQKKLQASGFEVIRVSSSGGLLGFANPDQYMRTMGYDSCVTCQARFEICRMSVQIIISICDKCDNHPWLMLPIFQSLNFG